MPPRSRSRGSCQICNAQESKYSCSKCYVLYCSVPCYKKHKGTWRNHIHTQILFHSILHTPSSFPNTETEIELEAQLRPLTSLNWPYVPDESAYPDPLKRDDPKPLQLNQYEAIATSSAVRNALASHPRLKDVLRKIDSLRGQEREEALQRALGVSQYDARGAGGYVEEDKVALRELAEAVETAVRGGKEGVTLGLDWGDTDSSSGP
ncbi:uncharacterized protein STEHIDRAFT_102293 [Stereum hirsutum FP-91666 SS1]|uniref:uncharacterized protein n=1 Tax=Stereum hirsutum (strain FP-91666) TaxID=721885 RepID=UPI0004449CA9|nr:uncharacterized protein STEHIDRAFT_102293 [Stereum hirsutum FP-91666 SS1]EIM82866.1 hypothetical protein STEHIDRAFT_102293 [Stereum hirsutum FP-91666 SS1]